MRRAKTALLICVLSSTLLANCSGEATQRPTAPQLPSPIERYRAAQAATESGCPTFDAIDLERLPARAWSQGQSRHALHEALRGPGGLADAQTKPHILLSWSGGHHGYSRASVIAARDSAGVWRATGVSIRSSGVARPPTEPTAEGETRSELAWTLSEADARQLDALIAGRCLHAEPRNIVGPLHRLYGQDASCFGGVVATLEIVTGDRAFIGSQGCGQLGAAGEVARLILVGGGWAL